VSPLSAIPHDPGLPGLADFLPASGAPPAVAAFAATRDPGADPATGRIVYVRYRPTRSCVSLWHFHRASGRPLWIWAKQLPDARRLRAAEEALGALAARAGGTGGPAPWRSLPERGLLLHAFGLDPRLPALARAQDSGWAATRLAPCLGLPPGAALAQARGLSYKPERRCVFHYRWEAAAGGVSHYAKLFRDDRGARLLAWQRDLVRQLGTCAGGFESVAPLAHLDEERMLVFPTLEGEKATRAIEAVAERRAPPERITAHVARAARGLARLQACRLDGLPEEAPPALVERFARDAAGVARVEGGLAGAVRERLQRLDAARDALAPEPLVPTHGAFRHGQLLLRRGATAVLDFDTLSRSGASADAGNFLAYLELTSLRRPRLASVLDACREAFLAELAAPHAPWLAWYQALSLLKVTLRAFLSLDPAWPRLAPACLRAADRALGGLPAGARRAAAC
jgi:hypothetical protein